MSKYSGQEQNEEDKYRDRWILECLQHKIAPIVKNLKKNMLVKISKGLRGTVEELEKAITQMILDERKRTRDGD